VNERGDLLDILSAGANIQRGLKLAVYPWNMDRVRTSGDLLSRYKLPLEDYYSASLSWWRAAFEGGYLPEALRKVVLGGIRCERTGLEISRRGDTNIAWAKDVRSFKMDRYRRQLDRVYIGSVESELGNKSLFVQSVELNVSSHRLGFVIPMVGPREGMTRETTGLIDRVGKLHDYLYGPMKIGVKVKDKRRLQPGAELSITDIVERLTGIQPYYNYVGKTGVLVGEGKQIMGRIEGYSFGNKIISESTDGFEMSLALLSESGQKVYEAVVDMRKEASKIATVFCKRYKIKDETQKLFVGSMWDSICAVSAGMGVSFIDNLTGKLVEKSKSRR